MSIDPVVDGSWSSWRAYQDAEPAEYRRKEMSCVRPTCSVCGKAVVVERACDAALEFFTCFECVLSAQQGRKE